MPWIIAAAVVIAVLLISRYTYNICFYVKKDHFEDPYEKVDNPQYRAVQHLLDRSTLIMEQTECEDVYIQSHDGLTLHGRFYDVAEGAPVIIVFHGYRSSALRDCAGGFSLGLKFGYNVLAVDQRALGQSAGRVISFGIRERYDCLKWIEYARSRFGEDVPIILCGISMGAATILMSSSLQLPKNVRGIMADCPFSSPSAIIKKVCKEVGYPPALAFPFLWLGALIYGGFRLCSCDAVSAVKNTDIPILLIHGADDRFVPCYMSEEIYENCKDHAQLHIFPNAGHGLSYIIDPVRYEQICLKFLEDVI